jgi:hypothetical protein
MNLIVMDSLQAGRGSNDGMCFMNIAINIDVEMKSRLKLPSLERLSVMLATFTLISGQSLADTWQHTITYDASTEYETNPLLLPANPGGVTLASFSPKYALSGTSGLNAIQGGIGLHVVESSDTVLARNRVDPNASLNWKHQSNVGQFGILASYDAISTRITTFDTTTGLASSDLTGLVSEDSTRYTRAFSANWSKSVSEKGTLSADGGYSSDTFTNALYVNYATKSGDLKYEHALSENFMAFVSLSYIEQIPVGIATTSRVNPMFGVDLNLSGNLEARLAEGRSRGDGADNFQAVASMKYRGQLDDLELNAARLTTPSGLGDFVTYNQANANWTHHLRERTRAGVRVGWRENVSITDDTYRSMDLWLHEDLTGNWEFRTHCLHGFHVGGGVGPASSNELGIALVYSRPEF